MPDIKINKLLNADFTGNAITFLALLVLLYLAISIFFVNHFFFNTIINGVDVSLKPHAVAEKIIKSKVKEYKLLIIERDGETEEIMGQEIAMKYNEKNSINNILQRKNSFTWIASLVKEQRYYIQDMFAYDGTLLESRIEALNCLNKAFIEPRNVGFSYTGDTYELMEEVWGNRIIRDKLDRAVKMSILMGEAKLDLSEKSCYKNPKYTLSSDKVVKTQGLLNRYVATRITYKFGDKIEVLDGSLISQWLHVNEDLNISICKDSIKKYVLDLAKKYDTVGKTRKIKTSASKVVEVKGGLYGWKINNAAETNEIIRSIKRGEIVEKEPIYAQRALYREVDDIGSTYVEINITRQYLWFYKEGKLIAQGSIVSGNPNRGYATKTGTYMLNYKQKGSTLRGPDYEIRVEYWMPFYGNIGIHDASWRYSFGRKIYKRNGSHGCINAPLYLAKTIFDNIEDGTPIVCYEE